MPETTEEKLLDVRDYVSMKFGATLTHTDDDGNRIEDLTPEELEIFATQLCDKIRKPKNPTPSIGG